MVWTLSYIETANLILRILFERGGAGRGGGES